MKEGSLDSIITCIWCMINVYRKKHFVRNKIEEKKKEEKNPPKSINCVFCYYYSFYFIIIDHNHIQNQPNSVCWLWFRVSVKAIEYNRSTYLIYVSIFQIRIQIITTNIRIANTYIRIHTNCKYMRNGKYLN